MFETAGAAGAGEDEAEVSGLSVADELREGLGEGLVVDLPKRLIVVAVAAVVNSLTFVCKAKNKSEQHYLCPLRWYSGAARLH